LFGGYLKKIIFVDLTKKIITEKVLNDSIMANYLGGYGIGAKIIYDLQKKGLGPFDEENIMGFLTGPLTGTGLPFVSRFTVVGKSPLTGGWGDANCRGYFGPTLKFSGYDGIFFFGKSDKPCYFFLSADKKEIGDAGTLWGEDTYRTEDKLQAIYGNDSQIACIGPAGEKLSKNACIITAKGKAAGRSGLGALMGSKKLKAVIVKGNIKIKAAYPEKIRHLREKYTNQMKQGVGFADFYTSSGTPGYAYQSVLNGDSPVKNWSGVGIRDIDEIDNFDYENIKKYIVKKSTCYHCPMGDWKYAKIDDGPYALEEMASFPEYETISMLGINCLNTNFESIIKCNDICNRFGMDTISTGAVIAFALNCYEAGIITRQDTDGIELRWGNHRSIVELTEKIAKREGIGEVLADGVKIAAEKIGKKSWEYAIHIGGQELPGHDSRFEPSIASIYLFDATPGRHTQASQYCVPPKLAELYPEIDFSFSFGNKNNTFSGRAKAQRMLSSLMHCVNSLGFCLFGYLSTHVNFLSECYSAVTGNKTSLDELMTIGERIGILRLAFNIREGQNILERNIPGISKGIPPLKKGPNKDICIDLELMKTEYFQEMNWDLRTGKPNQEKLRELNLDYLTKDIWK